VQELQVTLLWVTAVASLAGSTSMSSSSEGDDGASVRVNEACRATYDLLFVEVYLAVRLR
jgi:hypothetical protein